MTIEYSPVFAKAYKKLPAKIKEVTEDKVNVFIKSPFDKRLKLHKLSGPLKNYWSFWINYRYRIVFSFVNSKKARFHTIGGHSIYK